MPLIPDGLLTSGGVMPGLGSQMKGSRSHHSHFHSHRREWYGRKGLGHMARSPNGPGHIQASLAGDVPMRGWAAKVTGWPVQPCLKSQRQGSLDPARSRRERGRGGDQRRRPCHPPGPRLRTGLVLRAATGFGDAVKGLHQRARGGYAMAQTAEAGTLTPPTRPTHTKWVTAEQWGGWPRTGRNRGKEGRVGSPGQQRFRCPGPQKAHR